MEKKTYAATSRISQSNEFSPSTQTKKEEKIMQKKAVKYEKSLEKDKHFKIIENFLMDIRDLERACAVKDF